MKMAAMPGEAARLFELDKGLRSEANRMLEASGLGEILRLECFGVVGSYAMQTMTWRDLDFERIDEAPDWDRHWALGMRLAKLSWVWKFSCANAYRQPEGVDQGLYWGVRLSDPAGGPIWKVDLWTARREEFVRGSPNRARWATLLTDETRFHIMAIKEAVCDRPEYRRALLSVHIYEAVLDRGVRGISEFMRWWQSQSESVDSLVPG